MVPGRDLTNARLAEEQLQGVRKLAREVLTVERVRRPLGKTSNGTGKTTRADTPKPLSPSQRDERNVLASAGRSVTSTTCSSGAMSSQNHAASGEAQKRIRCPFSVPSRLASASRSRR